MRHLRWITRLTESTASPATPPATRPGWRQVLASLRTPNVAIMLALGFAAGIPFMLVGNTLGFWLRESGIELKAVGFLSWAGLAYSLKFLWAPLIDKVDAPLLGFFGRRRSWMLLAQLIIAAGLLSMAILTPNGGLYAFAGLAVMAAFASATQDIVIDAWRIETAERDEQQALFSASYLLGYRAALLVTDALILIAAAKIGWPISYGLMAALMGIGIAATLFAKEPAVLQTSTAKKNWSARGLFDAVIGPFIAFFVAHKHWALLMLATIALYRLADFVMGPMAGPLYIDIGFTKEEVGLIRGSFGLVATIIGTATAGVFAVRYGMVATLIAGAIVGPASNLGFAYLAFSGADTTALAIAMVIDNFSGAFAGIALIAYMSSLTNVGYTATQYALLSSFYALPGKFLKGFSGQIIDDWLTPAFGLLPAYGWFFIGTALIGIPAVIGCALIAWRNASLRAA